MSRLMAKNNILLLLAALMFALAFINSWANLAWFCLIPLFVALFAEDKSKLPKQGFHFGAVFALVAYYWLPDVIAAFVGGNEIYGWLFYLIAVLIAGGFFALLFYVFGLLNKPSNAPWVRVLLMAAMWTLGERLLSFCFEGMPWFNFQAGNLLLGNLYFIQPAEWGGVYLLSFVVIFVNAWLAGIVNAAEWKQIWMPGLFLAAYFGASFLLFQHATSLSTKDAHTVSIAMMCENSAPEEKWNKNNGAQMVKTLLQLNQQATQLQPDIVLWTESAVPWTYQPGDDFVKEVVKIGAKENVTQIMGINTEFDEKSVYNSAYCISPGGAVAGRYDKRFLLTLAEKPLSFFSLPFLSTDGFYAQPGENATPLPTPKGKAGVLICNEVLLATPAVDMVRNGAGFLVNISNDGWFSNVKFLVRLHFYSARLRAVEVRRDIAINSNLGISGKVSLNGNIVNQRQSDQGFVEKVTLRNNSSMSLFARYPPLFIYLLLAVVLFFIVSKLKYSKPK